MRCLKRRLSDIVYHQMVLDAYASKTGPGGHTGAAADSSAAGSSEKSLPGPATSQPTTTHAAAP
jgi:transposase